MVDVVANLNGAEKSRRVGMSKEKQVYWHGRLPDLTRLVRTGRKEFVEVFSREKLTWRRRRLGITPHMDHAFVHATMFFVRKF